MHTSVLTQHLLLLLCTVFAGLPQEVHILVAAARLYVQRGDVDAAIRMLDKIPTSSPSYTQTTCVKADLLLTHNHDKEGYAQCFVRLVSIQATAKHLMLLAEAYLRILNPERAIDVFLEAYKVDGSNSALRARIGETLVCTHEYHRAVEFYEKAVRQVIQQCSNTGSSASGAAR